MNKMWQVIRYEYIRHVLRRRFLFALLSVPIWIVVMGAVAVLAVVLTSNTSPIGYVDQSGLLANPIMPDNQITSGPFSDVKILAFSSEDAARAALDAKEIQAYYLIPPDYMQNRDARLVFIKEPDSRVQGEFESFLRRNLLASQPPQVAQRITSGPNYNIQTTQDQRQVQTNEWFKTAMPIAAGILLMVSVFTSGGYLMQAVVEEKENRTMEILVTSLSPMQLMGGKIIALIGVGLTQILVWSIFPIIAVIVAAAYIPTFSAAIDWRMLGLMFLLIVPTFIMIAALMAAIGSTVTEAREGQQVTGLITLPVMIPYMLMGVLITNPGSPIAIFLSFFPLTAALTILIRIGFGSVPTWQSLTSAGILVVSAVGALWLAGRAFRLGMLRYGQRLKLKDLFGSLRRAS